MCHVCPTPSTTAADNDVPPHTTTHTGESEAGLKGVFAAARALAPSVIFIDEVDALAPSREGGGGGGMSAGEGGGMSGRIVTVLLTLMDGVAASGPGVD